MSEALPGQRAGQRPLRAAVSAQRAIGRAVTQTSVVAETFVIYTDAGWEQVAADGGRDHLVPYAFGQQGEG